jgi:hypothetical protein
MSCNFEKWHGVAISGGQCRFLVRPFCAAGICQSLRVFALFFAEEGAQFFNVMAEL